MNCENILSKSIIRKYDYEITWKKIEVEDIQVKNIPKDLENMDAGFNTVDITADEATIKGGIDLDIRGWGVKDIRSRASKIQFVMNFEDTETDIYEDIDVMITDITNDKLRDETPLNPAYVDVVIDMKGQKDPSKFDAKATIFWQGAY